MADLIEPTELADLGLTVGFLHIPGAGFRVGTVGGGDSHTRHFSIAATRRLADQLAAEQLTATEPDIGQLGRAVALLREKADRLDGWLKQRRDAAQIDEFEALRESEPA